MPEPTVVPGLGRIRRWLEPGAYSSELPIALLSELVAEASYTRLRVVFRNRSSVLVDAPDQLADVGDYREIAYVSVYLRFSDGSVISGRPINSPLPGFIWLDDESSERSGIDTRKKRIVKRQQKANSTLSHERGSAFLASWGMMERKATSRLRRFFKFVIGVPSVVLIVAAGFALAIGIPNLIVYIASYATFSFSDGGTSPVPLNLRNEALPMRATITQLFVGAIGGYYILNPRKFMGTLLRGGNRNHLVRRRATLARVRRFAVLSLRGLGWLLATVGAAVIATAIWELYLKPR